MDYTSANKFKSAFAKLFAGERFGNGRKSLELLLLSLLLRSFLDLAVASHRCVFLGWREVGRGFCEGRGIRVLGEAAMKQIVNYVGCNVKDQNGLLKF